VRESHLGHGLQEHVRVQRHLVDLATHEVVHERRRAALERSKRFPERVHLAADAGLAFVLVHEGLDPRHERGEALAAVHLELACDQIGGLDVIRAFVDGEDLDVAATAPRDGPSPSRHRRTSGWPARWPGTRSR
jgi:hypothetical protein